MRARMLVGSLLLVTTPGFIEASSQSTCPVASSSVTASSSVATDSRSSVGVASSTTSTSLYTECLLRLEASHELPFTHLSFVVEFPPESGSFVQPGFGIRCRHRLDKSCAEIDFARRENEPGRLEVSVESIAPMIYDLKVANCEFAPGAAFEVGQARAVEISASDLFGNPVLPPPFVRASGVYCAPPNTTTTMPTYYPPCGVPVSGGFPTSADALYVLRGAIGEVPCVRCQCDVNRSGSVTASDALMVLAASLGLDTPFRCPG